MTRRQGRRSKKLLDYLKDRRGYCELMEEPLDRTMWRNRFARGFGPVVWQITNDNDDLTLPKHDNYKKRVRVFSRTLDRARITWDANFGTDFEEISLTTLMHQKYSVKMNDETMEDDYCM